MDAAVDTLESENYKKKREVEKERERVRHAMGGRENKGERGKVWVRHENKREMCSKKSWAIEGFIFVILDL